MIIERLVNRIGLEEVKEFARWAESSKENTDFIWQLSYSSNRRQSVNSLWILTHLIGEAATWMEVKQEEIINRLLEEKDSARKRIFLQLLREQKIDLDSPASIKLLDFCFSKINSECEPYAIRAFCIYVAFNISRKYPELISELEQHLNFLALQSLSPGLKCALNKVRRKMKG